MDYHTRTELNSSLTKDSTFASFSCNSDRVKYALAEHITTERISNQIKENLATMRQKVAKCGVKTKCYTDEAKMHMAAKDGIQALAALRKALLYAPADKIDLKVELYMMMIEVHYELKVNYEGALWAIEQAIELLKEETSTEEVKDLNSKLGKTMFLQANVLKKLHRHEEAAQIVEKLLTSVSDDDNSNSKDESEEEQSPIINRKSLKKLLEELKEEGS